MAELVLNIVLEGMQKFTSSLDSMLDRFGSVFDTQIASRMQDAFSRITGRFQHDIDVVVSALNGSHITVTKGGAGGTGGGGELSIAGGMEEGEAGGEMAAEAAGTTLAVAAAPETGGLSLLEPLLELVAGIAGLAIVAKAANDMFKPIMNYLSLLVQLLVLPFAAILQMLFKPFLVIGIVIMYLMLQWLRGILGIGGTKLPGGGTAGQAVDNSARALLPDLTPLTDLLAKLKDFKLPDLSTFELPIISDFKWPTIPTIDWATYIPGLKWVDYVLGIVWSDLINSPIWKDIIAQIEWALIILPPAWKDFIKSLTWDNFIKLLTWSNFIETLDWGKKVLILLWTDFLKILKWVDFIFSLVWADFIAKIIWDSWVPHISWSSFIPSVNWGDFIGKIGGALGFHDVMVSPGGQIISTDPADYIIALKNPAALAGGGGGGDTYNVTNNFNNPVVRQDADFDKLVQKFNQSLMLKAKRSGTVGGSRYGGT